MHLNLKPLPKRLPSSVDCEFASPALDNCRGPPRRALCLPSPPPPHALRVRVPSFHGRVRACKSCWRSLRDHASHQAAVVNTSRLVLLGTCTCTWISASILLTRAATAGEQKDFEVYSCDVSPDGTRLATAAGGSFTHSRVSHAVRLLGHG